MDAGIQRMITGVRAADGGKGRGNSQETREERRGQKVGSFKSIWKTEEDRVEERVTSGEVKKCVNTGYSSEKYN